MDVEVRVPSDKIAADIANYTVGFARIETKDGIRDGFGAGSGTLVQLNNVFGILTASHVLESLPEIGEVGIVPYIGDRAQYGAIKIRMEFTDRLQFGGQTEGEAGPDLAFIKLSEVDAASLKAKLSFYNLVKGRELHFEADDPKLHKVDIVAGMIDERTKGTSVPGALFKVFEAIISNGVSRSAGTHEGYDLIDFDPVYYPDFAIPGNFGGTSGGAIWRAFFSHHDGVGKIVKRRLLGVPFRQSPLENEKRTLRCHGPESIFVKIYKEISDRWQQPQVT